MKQKETNQPRQTYMAPAIEIIEVENEGVMAASANGVSPGGNYGNGGSMFGSGTRSSSSRTSPHNTSTLGELEDIINDILTVRK